MFRTYLRKIGLCLSALTVILCVGCQQQASQTRDTEQARQLKDVEHSPNSAKRGGDGHVAYVPCYSHIRLADGRPYNLAINLSIRNTRQEETLTVTLVDYYNSKGTLVKHHASDPIVLKPLETADFFVSEKDSSGGTGANFIVEWETSGSDSPPIIEAVMVGTEGAQGVSFVTQGRVIR